MGQQYELLLEKKLSYLEKYFFLEILVNLATLELFLYNIKMPFFLEGKKVMLRSTFARVKQFCTKLTFILPGKLIQNSKFGIACKLKSEMEIP
jgi:hypothetical protein